MFENYEATKKDLEAIEKGIITVWHQKLNFIFKKKRLIEKAIVMSFDANFLYLWTRKEFPKLDSFPCGLKDYRAYKIPHNLRIKDQFQSSWKINLAIEEFEKYLPKKILKNSYQFPKISGSLLSPFIKSHQDVKKDYQLGDIYNTYESYLATVIHEFAHIYYNQHKLWWFSNKKQNLNLIKSAIKLFEGKRANINNLKIEIPYPLLWSEVFAFCTEYYSATLFWPMFKKELDKYLKINLAKLIKNPSFLSSRNSHDLAATIGKIIISSYSKDWPKRILQF